MSVEGRGGGEGGGETGWRSGESRRLRPVGVGVGGTGMVQW